MMQQANKQIDKYKDLSVLMHTHLIDIFSNLNDFLADQLKKESRNFLNKLLMVDNSKLSKYLFAAVLYCPSTDKIPEYLNAQGDKLEKVYKILDIINKKAIEKNQILQRLLQEADPFFEEILKEWAKEEKGLKTLSFKSILNTSFVPKKQSIAQSLEILWYIKRKKKYRNYATLLDRWELFLKKYIFEKTNWDYSKKEYFFTAWKRLLFNDPSPPQFPLKLRWKEGLAIDEKIASGIILYFIDKFIEKPHRFTYGEIACLLLLSIHLSFDDRIKLTLKKLLSLTSSQFITNISILKIDEKEIIIDEHIAKYLSVLKKHNNKLLFPSLNSEILSRMLKEASQFLCLKPFVSPEAFLSQPHIFYEQRKLPWLSRGMMDRDLFESQPDHQIGGILKPYNLPTQCFLNSSKKCN